MTLVTSVGHPLSTISFSNREDIEIALNTEGVSKVVDTILNTFHTTNVDETMDHLVRVGRLLQLAQAGSKGSSCERDVVEILCDYQTLIKNSSIHVGAFLTTSLKALNCYRSALKLAEKDQLQAAIQLINLCAQEAKKMATLSEQLASDSKRLCESSKKAILSATDAGYKATTQKKEVEEAFNKQKAKEAALTVLTQERKKEIDEEKERELKALGDAEAASTKTFVLNLVSIATQALGGNGLGLAKTIVKGLASAELQSGLDQQIESARKERGETKKALDKAKIDLSGKQAQLENTEDDEEKCKLKVEIARLQAEVQNAQETIQTHDNSLQELKNSLKEDRQIAEERSREALARRRELNTKQWNDLADIAESVEKLKAQSAEKAELSRAICSLEIASKTLGQVKTVFENIRAFWLGVESQCNNLTNNKNIELFAQSGLKDDFIEEVEASRWFWLALGKVNHSAVCTIKAADRDVDNIMSSFVTTDESTQLLTILSGSMLDQIKKDQNTLKEELARLST